jgi:hypothetical protein
MTGVFRFDCYPLDFLIGIVGLTGDEIAAYTVVMMRADSVYWARKGVAAQVRADTFQVG